MQLLKDWILRYFSRCLPQPDLDLGLEGCGLDLGLKTSGFGLGINICVFGLMVSLTYLHIYLT